MSWYVFSFIHFNIRRIDPPQLNYLEGPSNPFRTRTRYSTSHKYFVIWRVVHVSHTKDKYSLNDITTVTITHNYNHTLFTGSHCGFWSRIKGYRYQNGYYMRDIRTNKEWTRRSLGSGRRTRDSLYVRCPRQDWKNIRSRGRLWKRNCIRSSDT